MVRVSAWVVVAVCQCVALVGVAITWLTVQAPARLYLEEAGAPSSAAALTVLGAGLAALWLVAPLPGPGQQGLENAPEAD